MVDRQATVEQIECVIQSLNRRKNDLITVSVAVSVTAFNPTALILQSNAIFRKLLLNDTLEKLRGIKAAVCCSCSTHRILFARAHGYRCYRSC